MTAAAFSPGTLEAGFVVQRGGFRGGVELRAEPGEIVALLGPNGAGKTTVFAALAGELTLDAGQIRLGERMLSTVAQTVPPRLRNIGQVYQDYLLFPHLSALDNVAFGPRAH